MAAQVNQPSADVPDDVWMIVEVETKRGGYPPRGETARALARAILSDRQAREEARDGGGDSRLGEHHTIAHDGFTGTVIGSYVTVEGKRGVVMQQDGTRVVHVYGEKWLPAIEPSSVEGDRR